MSASHDIDPLHLAPGTQLHAYRLVRYLGTGGMGTTLLCERDGRHLVLKLGRHKLSAMTREEREQAESRIRREGALAMTFDHPAILRAEEIIRWPGMDDYLVIVTEYIDGDPLCGWMERTSPSFRTLCEVFIEICEGLEELHRKTVIHRDIKSDNLLVDRENHAHIIDLGIARGDSSVTLTAMSNFVGTSEYQSPEHANYLIARARGLPEAAEPYSYGPSDDLYALAVVLYRALCGRMPHENANEFELLRSIALDTPTPLAQFAPAVPAELAALVDRLLLKEPSERFDQFGPKAPQLARQLAEMLEALLASAGPAWDVPYQRPASSGADRTSNRRSRRRTKPPTVGGIADADAMLADLVPGPPTPLPAAAQPGGDAVPFPAPPPVPTPVVSPQPMRQPTDDRRVGFVEDERPKARPSERSDGSTPAVALPTAVREVAALGARGGKATPQRTLLLGAATLLVLAVFGFVVLPALLRPTAKAQDLLTEFERQKAAQMNGAPAVTPPAQASVVTTLPPAAPAPRKEPEPQPAAAAATPPAPVAAAVPSTSRRSTTRNSVASAGAKTAAAAPESVSPQPKVLGVAPVSTAARTIPAGLRCKVELRSDVHAATQSVPVDVVFRVPCFRNNEQEIIPEWSTASGAATASDGRVLITLDAVRLVGAGAGAGDALPVTATAVHAGGAGVPGVRSLKAPEPAGAKVVAAAGQIAQRAVVGQLPTQAQELVRSAEPAQARSTDPAFETVSLRRGTEFFVVFKEQSK